VDGHGFSEHLPAKPHCCMLCCVNMRCQHSAMLATE
jgi:hypothetical protein